MSTVRWAPARLYGGAVGWGARRTVPRPLREPVYRAFARVVGADLDEVELPLAEYACFGAFFARGLKGGAREVARDPDAIAAPCDGTVGAAGEIASGQLIQAKGRRYDLAELVASAELAGRLEGGAYVTMYLSPRDYHRVHAPVAGEIVGHHHVPGALFPVSGPFVDSVPDLFARNERVVVRLDTELGEVALVLVAAVGVGNVAVRDDTGAVRLVPRRREARWRPHARRPAVARGDEIGAFHLGSTVIALFEPGGADLGALAPGTQLRTGQALGRLARAATHRRRASERVT